MQEELRDLGWYNGECHGRFDEATKIALIGFQTRVGLQPDGKCGPCQDTSCFGESDFCEKL